VSEKDIDTSKRIIVKHGIAPERFLMVGNSLNIRLLPTLLDEITLDSQ